jgi:hypothetical protein
MTIDGPELTAPIQTRPWRRVLVVSCMECDWREMRRDYRSRKKINLNWARRRTIQHQIETGHQGGAILPDHV